MNLELVKNDALNISDSIKNATTTVNQVFNNVFDKGMNNLSLDSKILSKVKDGLKNVNIKEIASKTIDTTMKSFLKGAANLKAGTVDSIKDFIKSVRDSNVKGALRSAIKVSVDQIKGIPTSAKKVVKDGIDLVLGDTFDDELKKVMTTQKNTLSRINKKCDEFDKALKANDEKALKKYANSISKDLEKISLISDTINRGKEVLNKYKLMQNKGSTELNEVEQELLQKIS